MLAGAAGVWLGIQGLRLFLTMVVWNVAEDQPATRMALWALGLYLPGLLAWVPARLAGGARPAWRFGLLFGLLTVLRPVRFGPVWTPALAFTAWIAWLWWWPAFLQELVRRRALGAAVPGILLGLMAQVAGQTALGGLDLPYLRSPGARAAAVLLVGAFLLCLWQLHRGPDREKGAPAGGEEASAALGAALTGPYLFLQLTWLANLGRIEIFGDWELAAAALFVQAGLASGLLGALTPLRSRPLRIGFAALGVGLALAGERLSGPGLWPCRR
ncbi:MAG: hypothetical protein L6E13_03570 [Firmicutes bacterium]|nr:hypothetical protein [Bacillota bacterium]